MSKVAPKIKITPYISYMTGHHICFILDKGGEVKNKERRGGNVGSSTINFYEYDFIVTMDTLCVNMSLGDSCRPPEYYVKHCNV